MQTWSPLARQAATWAELAIRSGSETVQSVFRILLLEASFRLETASRVSGSSLVNNGRSTMASRRASASPPTRVIIDKSATAAVAAKINAAGSRTPPVVVNANGYGFIKDCTDVKNGNSALSPLPPPVQSSSELIQTSYRPGCYPQQQSSSTLSNIPIYENLNDNEPSVPLRASRVPPPPPPPPYVAKVIESPPVLPPKGRPPYLAPPVYENVYEEELSSTLPGDIMT